jgi:hypothetical protein
MASLSIFDTFPKEFRYYLLWKINDKWCSLLTGFVGFLISIPAQRIFPAPIRVFYGTVVFGIKQILDIFFTNLPYNSSSCIWSHCSLLIGQGPMKTG